MTVEEDVRKNSKDIHELTVNVTRLATIVENSEKRHDSDMDVMKEAVQGISRLNERIGATVGMEKDIASMRETMAEQKGDIRTIRHDLNNALNAITGISIVNEKLNEATSTIAAQGAKIEGLESWRDKMDGAGIMGLNERVNKLELVNSNKDGKVAAFTGTAKGVWSFVSTPFWMAVTAVTVWILSGMYGGKGPIGGE
ncbi:hypothetical protein GobsT_50920 [Gemmata obscuriglobus]|uniref:Uncharacterized protein n=1 Tax=Gemmata obscuriglobus TaxID=114 RepID=A0A2Z3GWM8_9BACT|nr:hypothetical protein [Gemmata obscuriglobus]AWM37011.1 hypothetical protein C1280_08250 [Gemmata obscuriglobus]QEG30288.1 hypothetical protein GobsT_50920 [Gemmata obscuriglobus]VTS09612.1 unnamed protein product [Gemmata obscuriglobus UQM 2246]